MVTATSTTSGTADSSSSDQGATRPTRDDGRISTADVRQRAVTGAAVDVLRGLGSRFVGLFGTLVLARMLTPRDFGTVAVGATLIVFANFLGDAGIGAALIRRVEPPERADLRALLGFQIAISTALAIVISAATFALGTWGQVTALMMIALPLTATRAPAVILSERKLNYKPFAVVEIVESLFYYGWAIGLALAGWGVWGLASATVVRAAVGSTVLLLLVPAARLSPSPSWARLRGSLGFGLRYQAVGATIMLRDQGINAAVALVAGVPALGVWSVASRILQIPYLLLSSLWRVSFPGMARLVEAKEDMRQTIERVLGVVAVVAGLILVPLVAATPAWVPALLGHKWTDVVAVIPPASLALMIASPVTVALIGYLWAVGEASAVLRATLVGIPLMAAAMIPLLTVIGVPAVGVGWLAASIGELTVLIRAARKHAEFNVARRVIPPTTFAVLAAGAGWLVATEVGTTVVGGLAGGLSAVVIYLLALWLWHKSYLLDSVQLSLRGLRGALNLSTSN